MQTVILLLASVVGLLFLAVCYLVGINRELQSLNRWMQTGWDEYCRKGGTRDQF